MIALLLATTINTHATVQLRAPDTFVRGTNEIAIEFKVQPEWHIYWENPGDSGEEPRAAWTASVGTTVGKLEYPIPTRLPAGPFTNFGFGSPENRPVVFRAPVQVNTSGNEVDLSLSLTYLVCKEACVPEKADLKIRVPVSDKPVGALSFQDSDFPKRSGVGSRAEPHRARFRTVGDTLQFEIPNDWKSVERFEFFPLTTPALAASDAGTKIAGDKNGVAEFSVTIDSAVENKNLPAKISGLLVDAKNSKAEWIEFTSDKQFSWLGLLSSIGFAILGGLLLNLMPCVFPVVSLKVLSFVREGAGHPREIRQHAFVYVGGIFVSLWALVLVLLLIRSAGAAIGWGFQLQNPTFLFLLLGVFFFLGLNLIGVFEFNYQGPLSLQNLMTRRGYVGSFLTGLLTTIVATPCSAPFMGVAIGSALAGSPIEAFVIFSALAFGLSSPYVVLALRPAWVAKLPRPGAWMETLRGVLAFPLFLTSVWLFWVLTQTTDIGALVLVLGWCVAAAFFAWTLRLASSSKFNLSLRIASVLVLIATTALTISTLRPESSAASVSTSETWQPYSDARLKSELANGKSIFVDFTASWCVTCQVNKRLVLNTDAGNMLFVEKDIVRLRADWTKRDPEITNALSRLGRNSVPVYAYYRTGSSEAHLLPEILTIDILKNALEAK